MRRYEIVCETRGGFHASFGRGDPCTQCKRRCGTSSLLEGVNGERGVGEFTSLVILRERRPAASRPVGEGAGPQDASAVGRGRFLLSSISSRDLSLCHPERSEGSRASARAAAIGAGNRSVRRDSSLQRLPLRMTQKNVGASFCDVVAAPSPTGRDAAGRLSRKITGEVRTETAPRPMPGNLTPNPFPRGKGNQSRKVGF
jgi:hypothetical protein